MVKCLPTMQETRVRSLGGEDPLEKEMATHSSTLAWKIPWTEVPGRLQSMGLQRVRHDWVTSLSFSLVPLYILGSFVKNKVPIGSWIYLWASYLVPLVYISVFVPVPYCLNDCSFVVLFKSVRLIPPAPVLFLKTPLTVQGLLGFHMNCEFFLF